MHEERGRRRKEEGEMRKWRYGKKRDRGRGEIGSEGRGGKKEGGKRNGIRERNGIKRRR